MLLYDRVRELVYQKNQKLCQNLANKYIVAWPVITHCCFATLPNNMTVCSQSSFGLDIEWRRENCSIDLAGDQSHKPVAAASYLERGHVVFHVQFRTFEYGLENSARRIPILLDPYSFAFEFRNTLKLWFDHEYVERALNDEQHHSNGEPTDGSAQGARGRIGVIHFFCGEGGDR
jgi:hypothetical protein